MNRSKTLLSKLWRLLPGGLRWCVISALSPRFVVGVAGVVLNDQAKVLLAHHVYRSHFAWGLPGGIIQHGEAPSEALYREILEETGLQVQVGPLLQYGVASKWPNVTFHYLCTVQGAPRPVVCGELFEAGFFAPDALPCALEPAQARALAYALQVYRLPPEAVAARIIETEEP